MIDYSKSTCLNQGIIDLIYKSLPKSRNYRFNLQVIAKPRNHVSNLQLIVYSKKIQALQKAIVVVDLQAGLVIQNIHSTIKKALN